MYPCVLMGNNLLSGGEETFINDFALEANYNFKSFLGGHGPNNVPQNPLVVVGMLRGFASKRVTRARLW